MELVGQVILNVEKIERHLFDGRSSEIIVVSGDEGYTSPLSPVMHFDSVKDINKKDLPLLRKVVTLPEQGGFYVIDTRSVKDFVGKFLTKNSENDERSGLWFVSVVAIWVRVKAEVLKQSKLAPHNFTKRYKLFLQPVDLVDCLQPFVTVPVDDVEAALTIDFHLVWKTASTNLIALFGKPEIARQVLKHKIESQTVARLSIECGTEENSLAFLKSCKDMLFTRLDSL